MADDIIEKTKTKMTQVLDHLKQELKSVRAGRASPALIEGVQVEVYGTMMRIRDVATITTPEARQLLITPFDASNVQACARAIEKANLGFTAVVEGKCMRITIPQLDEARRKDLCAQCHKKREEAKISVRNIRRETNETIKKQKQDSLITEDDVKRLEKQAQDLTDRFCKECDDDTTAKEKEIMTV